MSGQTILPLAVFFALLGFAVTQLPPCGTSGNQCIEGQSSCVGGTCVCKNPPFVYGDGFFACYRKNQVAGEVRNDPSLRTFNNETTDFPYPCRSLFTHVKQDLKDRNRNVIGTCEFEIYQYNRKNRGKFFAHGFDIAIRLTYNNGNPDVELSTRRYGIAVNGVNQFTVNGTNGAYNPHGPWGTDDITYVDSVNGIEVVCREMDINNQLVFEAKACGLLLTFVPYDVVLRRDQPQIPGLSVAINCAHKPRWLSLSRVMALAPVFDGGDLFSDITRPGLTVPQSVIVRAFETGIPQNQPNRAFECQVGQQFISACNDSSRAAAMNACFWMLEEPRFIRCFDDSTNGNALLFVFNDCISSHCDGVRSCQNAIDFIVDRGCDQVSGIPKLTQFVNGDLCP